MASVGIGCEGNRYLLNSRWPESNPNARAWPCCVPISGRDFDSSKQKRWKACSATMKSSGMGMAITKDSKNVGGRAMEAAAERLDEWMKESVVEIVKNLREAPLLVHVYDKGETTTLKTEKAVEEETWPQVMEKWRRGERVLPEGVIFVEQLEDEDEEEEEEEEEAEEMTTRAWGVVVQGKGVECGPVCYLLKTSRVGSGVGVWCTHFCLMRVNGFRESTRSQLKNCWLLQAQ